MRHRRLVASIILGATLLLPATASAASPVAANDQAATNEDTPLTMDLLRNDSDPDGDPIHISGITQGAGGQVSLAPVAGFVLFTPNRNFNGTVTFGYTIADSGGATASAIAMVFVIAVNDPPEAFDRFATTSENHAVSIVLQAIDPDKEGCDLTFRVPVQAAYGTFSTPLDAGCSPNGDMATTTYTPDPGFSGTETQAYSVSDGSVVSSASITITVVPLPRVHVGDLDGRGVKGSGSWAASVTVRVDDTAHDPVDGAQVSGTWTTGGSSFCTTTAGGTCIVTSGMLSRSVKASGFTVTGVFYGDNLYDSSLNHDPDADSNGTSITIARP